MIAKIIRNGQVFEIDDFDQLIVEKADGTPVAVAAKYGPEGVAIVSSIDNPDRFKEVLRRLGINRAVVITNLSESLRNPSSLRRII